MRFLDVQGEDVQHLSIMQETFSSRLVLQNHYCFLGQEIPSLRRSFTRESCE
jgi:hypothetical protein